MSRCSPCCRNEERVKFSDEMLRFLRSGEELTWKVPEGFKKTNFGCSDLTVFYHPLLVPTDLRSNSPDSNNSDTCLIATFYRSIAAIGKLYTKEPSIFFAAPSSLKDYRLHSNIYLTSKLGFWYQSLAEGRTALRKARESLEANRIPDCQIGDFDSRFCVAYVEAGGHRGCLRYRPLEESWKTLTFHDDASMTNTNLTGNVSAASRRLSTRARTDVEATTSMLCSRKRPAPDHQEAGTSGASAGVPPVTGDQEGRVLDASHRTAPELPAKRAKSSNGEELMSQKSKKKNARRRLKDKIRHRMAKFYPHLEWSSERPREMSVRFEISTEPSSEEEQRKMMDIKNELQALFKQLNPGSSVELPNPKLP